MSTVDVSKYLRRLGEPSVEVDPATGLKRITRRYVVDITGLESANLDAHVLASFGDADEEHADAVLVEQSTRWSEETANNILTRVFQELGGGTALVEVGEPVAEKVENNLWRVTRTLVTAVGSAADIAAQTDPQVGTDSHTHDGTELLLGNWRREVQGGTIARYTKVYQEPGIIRVDINSKYGGALTEYNVIGFAVASGDVTPGDLGLGVMPYLADTGKDNYQGLQTVRFRFVEGEGIISISRSSKTGASAIVEYVIVSVNQTPSEALQGGHTETHGGEAINADWLEGVGLNSLDTSARDNYIIYTARYIKLDGEAGYVGGSAGGTIEGGEITIGDINVETEWSGFNIPGDSILSDNTSLGYNGQVEIRDISFIIDLETAQNFDALLYNTVIDPNGNWSVIGTRVQLYPGYAVGEFKMVRGSGVISASVDTRFADVRPGYAGGRVYQVQAINIPPTEVEPFTKNGVEYDFAGARVIRSEFRNTEAGPVYTMELFIGEAITGISTATRYDGKLTVTTVTGLNINPLDFYGDQFGAAVDHETEVNQYGTLHKYVFAEGEGVIFTKTETRYNGQVTVTTQRALNTQPEVPDGVFLISTGTETDRFGELHTFVWAEGSGIISTGVEKRYNGQLEIFTVQSINAPPEIPETAFLLGVRTESGSYGEVYTYRFAEGSGEISRSEESRHDGNLVITVVQSLNEVPSFPEGVHRISEKTETSDFGVIYTYRWAEGAGELSRSIETRHNGRLTITTIQWLNEMPPEGVVAGAVVMTRVESAEFGTVYTYRYAAGTGEISSSTRIRYNGNLTITRIRTLNEVPEVPSGARVLEEGTEDSDFGTIYTTRYAEGEGLMATETESRHNGNLTIVTERWLEIDPLDAGEYDNVAVISTTEEVTDYGTMFTIRYAFGEGELDTRTETRYRNPDTGAAVLTVETQRWLNALPPDDPDAIVISSSAEEGQFGTIHIIARATGGGLIGRQTESRLGGNVTITRETWLNTDPPAESEGEVTVSVQSEERPYGLVWTVVRASGTGEISRSTTEQFGGKIRIVEIRSLNEVPSMVATRLLASSSADHQYGTVHTRRWLVVVNPELNRSTQGRFPDQNGNPQLTVTSVARLDSPAEPPSGAYVVSTSSADREYGTIHTVTWAEGEGVLTTSESVRIRGEDGDVLKTYSVRALNRVPAVGDIEGLPADWANTVRQIGFSESSGEFGTVYEARFSAGKGKVSTTETRPYTGTGIIILRERHVNEPPPELPEGDRLISERVEDTDTATFYELTVARGSAIIAESNRNIYEGKFQVTTVQALEIYDPGELEGGDRGALVTTSVAQGSYGAVITFVFVRQIGSDPVIGQSDSVVLTDQADNAVITRHTISTLLETLTPFQAVGRFNNPASNSASNASLTAQQVQDTEFGPRIEQTWLVTARSGAVLSETETTLEFGAERRVITTLGEIRNRDVPSGFYLVGEQVNSQQNYTTVTSTYYKPPDGYTLDFEKAFLVPGLLAIDTTAINGYEVLRPAQTQTLEGTVEVQFTGTPPATTDDSRIFQPTAQLAIQFDSNDPAHPDFRTDKVIIMDGFYAQPGTSLIDELDGISVTGRVTLGGAEQPSSGTRVIGQTVEPYFFVDGTQIYKVTTTRINLSF